MTQEQEEAGGLRRFVNKVEDAVGGMVGAAAAAGAASADAGTFVENAGTGDLYEIEAARLALTKARREDVRDFAAMMVLHHTTSRHQLRSALRSTEVTAVEPPLVAPTVLDSRRQGMIDHLAQAGGDAFDDAYLDQQLMAHRETLTLLRGYGESGGNPQLASFARGGAPMVERRLRLVEMLRR